MTICRTIDDTGICFCIFHLCPGFADSLGLSAIEFIFPTDNAGLREPLPEERQKLQCRAQSNENFSAAAGNLGLPARAVDCRHLEVTQGGRMKDHPRILMKGADGIRQ